MDGVFIQIVKGDNGHPNRPYRVIRLKDGKPDRSFDPMMSAPIECPVAAQVLACKWGEIWQVPVMFTIIPEGSLQWR
jgi:hypothetical protein